MIKNKSKRAPDKIKNVFPNEKVLHNFSTLDQTQILKEFNLVNFGLTNEEYKERLEKYGKNELDKSRFSWFSEFIKAFFGPFNIILMLILAFNVISFSTGNFGTEEGGPEIFDYIGVVIIATMIISSGTMSLVQSAKSFFITKKLGNIVNNKATIIRHQNDDQLNVYTTVSQTNQLGLIKLGEEIDVRELVPGDLIYLSSGDMIPADVRIIRSTDLFINQSSLTGESMPVEKHAENSVDTENILDLENICFTGTSVISGSAIAIAVGTGRNTYFSTISKSIMEKRPVSSFEKGVRNVTRMLIIFMLVMIPIVLTINGITWTLNGKDASEAWITATLFAASVAVGLTPEMLPMIVTTNLASGAARMAKNKVVVKKLESIQSLGSIDILCTDKTGTLTNDKIELIDFVTTDKKRDERLLKLLYINSYFQTGLKNPMDKAVIDYIANNSQINSNFLDSVTKIDEIPFDFNRRKLTIVFKTDEVGTTMVTKGSVEEVIESCTKVYYQGKVVDLDEDLKRQMLAYNDSINEEGKRLLGIAYKDITDGKTTFKVGDESELVFFGFASFLDTPKPSAKKMIKLLDKYGVQLKILTGDNEHITRSICKMVDLKISGLVTGKEIDEANEIQLRRMVEENNIFVKLNPLQKVKIIKVLKQNDHIVGFMGDGINDAPVLRQSDVAISVNNATDIAKDASDIILLEKSLLVLEKGIVQGRTIFGNILKYMKITTASNFGNVLSMLIVAPLLAFSPMEPIQLLFQNLLYDLSQFAIALDRVDDTFVAKPQRWNAKSLVPFTLINGPVSSVFDLVTFAIAGFGLGYIGDYNNANGNLEAMAQAKAQFNASWFVVGLLTQAWVVQIMRTEKIPFIQSRAPWPVMLSTGIVTGCAFVFAFTPAATLLKMQSPPLWYAPIVLGILLSYVGLAQAVKVGYIKIYKSWL
ncbi:magnesium-translocating P-type ATPase [Mesoplasma syrphidae]|uniref:Magnesium-transporting ATPase, P-type 1 n=1 Tax=Mesoplasma syrphidae TaxID=225999 RepID=A0A2K9BRZ4_9MOLU|nr:magnesium-translocating P-type ATPase [Mesoplasma syrphidae]AUF83772.1 magnesium-translocating P-type ATPase [Mesoplasma syrphidae]